MVESPEIMSYELFPTHLVRSKCPSITPQDKQEMMDSTDFLLQWMMEQGVFTEDSLIPKYQTHAMLFKDDAPVVWKKLRAEFHQACKNYLDGVDDFVQNQDYIEFTHFTAWGFKRWESLNKTESNPWHDHNPAFLSGVYYLHDPGDGTTGGTQFFDPRKSPAIANIMQSVIIFPGWLGHRSVSVPTEEPRYVVAANAYVKVVP